MSDGKGKICPSRLLFLGDPSIVFSVDEYGFIKRLPASHFSGVVIISNENEGLTSDSQHAPQELIGAPHVYVMGRRVVATLLDFIPLGLLTWLVDSTFGIVQNVSVISPPAGIPYAASTAVALPWLYLMLMIYYTVQETLFGTTFGKKLMGLKVVQDDGSPITFKGAFLRNLVRPIDALASYALGWVLALCSARRRRLGDHLARTLVVSADSLSASSRRSPRPWLRLSILALLCATFLAFCLHFDYYDNCDETARKKTSDLRNLSGSLCQARQGLHG